MGNIITHSAINRFILTCTLGAFTFGSVVPIYAFPFGKEININKKIKSSLSRADLIARVKRC